MTLTQIIEAVRSNIGDRDDKDAVIRNGVSFGLMEALAAHIFRAQKYSSDHVITEGDSYVDLESGTDDVTQVRLINGLQSSVIIVWTREKFEQEFPSVSDFPTSNQPCYAYRDSTRLYFAPSSAVDATIRITYVKRFVFDTDESSLSISLLDGYVVAYATYWVLLSFQLFKEAQAWLATAGQMLRSAIEIDKRNSDVTEIMEPFASAPSVYANPEDPMAGMTEGPYGS